ncbi:arginine/lysine/ornithine decarboxylase [Cytobacillus eiseniae]|uniref:Arginine/lysine/ornithine decarboxylase n=1 Tax=Cytobacillus eiseniae TaxID=762947 RepID=A0ABS4RJH2_9BACI|nr:aminotransferase class I/II-fold pyridoxal phosphate-dependent enzyme [Cytobacillus eiseniae]MBP2242561.1 arginine/lysine/ornithine decarboxylase [Cytobacillus eiseniae]
MNQNSVPLFKQLKRHTEKNPISFHVPGHKYGELIQADGESYYKEMLRLDATELNGLDDLHSPEGVIKEAEGLLTQLYGVEKSFFLVNGSTVGNLAMIMTALKENDTVLVQRNCHKSIMNGIQLVKAHPIFLGPIFDEDWGVAGGVPVHTIEQAIERYPHAKAIILTYPNYYGMADDIEGIIELAHESNIPVLIDEAHGAHFIGGELFPQSAVHLKADIVVQSAHKTLPAMTMGAYLHFNSQFLSVNELSNHLQILQSSSPSYPILASLDIAREYLASFTREDGDALRETIFKFRQELQGIEGIKVLTYNNGSGDPLKITIQSTTSLSGYDIQKLLEKEGIYTEMADPFNVLLVFPLLKKDMTYPIKEIISRFKRALQPDQIVGKTKIKSTFRKPDISSLAISIKDRSTFQIGTIPLEDAVGKVCAQLIIPYPPGIPLLFPGELISKEDIETIRLLKKSGAKFQGDEDFEHGKIDIYLT